MQTFIIVGILHAVLLVILLLPKVRGSRSYSLLAFWLSLMIINQMYFLNTAAKIGVPKVLMLIGASIVLLVYPIYYFYVRLLTFCPRLKWYYSLANYLPFILLNMITIGIYLKDPDAINIRNGFIYSQSYPGLLYYGYIMALMPLLYYTLSYSLIRKFRIKVQENYSNIDRINLSWLLNGIYASIILLVLSFSAVFLATYFQLVPQNLSFQIVGIFNTMFILYLGYFGLRKTHFYSEIQLVHANENSTKYEKSNLTEEQAQLYKDKLLKYFVTSKPYLDDEINLQELAKSLIIPPNTLSQVINQFMGTSFLKLINSYRVEEVKLKMIDKKYNNYTLLAIGFECGFKSKSTFINAFKESTGQTPSSYKKNLTS